MRFFCLNEPGPNESETETEYSGVEPKHQGEARRCPSCGAFITLLPWLPPMRAELELCGNDFGDVVFGPGSAILISGRFKSLYDASDLTGLEGFDPVEIVRVIRRNKLAPKTAPPSYYCVDCVHSETIVDQEASGFVWEPDSAPTCAECLSGNMRSWKRVVFKPGTWSGEDVFEPRGLAGYFVTERFKQFCDEHKFRNIVLIPIEEYGYDFFAPV